MVGIHARDVPDHIPAIEANLLPVAEVSGLAFTVTGDRL